MSEREATPHHNRLVELLHDLFSPIELRRFVHNRYSKRAIDLREDSSPREYFDAFVALLRRHGELDSDFFAALRDERPKRAGAIDAAASSAQEASLATELGRKPSIMLSWVPAPQHPDSVSDGVLRLPAPRIQSSAEIPTDSTSDLFADEQAFHHWYCAEFWPLTLRWVALTVRNNGTSPASNIDISIRAPSSLCILPSLNQLRAHLHPARRLALALQDLVTPTEQVILRRDHESLLRPKHVKTMPPRMRMRMRITANTISIRSQRLMHTYALPASEPFAVIALPGAPAGSIALTCEIFCHQYLQRVQTSLTVLVEDAIISPDEGANRVRSDKD